MARGRLDFEMADVTLTEMQSLDLREIVTDKLRRAYDVVKGPVIVDDVSAGLDRFQELPGPFIKFFNQKLGGEALWKLAGEKSEKVTIRCMAAYYDGTETIIAEGVLHGVTVSPRGSNGFGFDVVVMPDGETRTMAEMSATEKIMVSHRGMAFRDLFQQIETLTVAQ